MGHPAAGLVARQIESLFDGSSVAGLTDRQLLERFTTQRDTGSEMAFSALVARHGPLVLGICLTLDQAATRLQWPPGTLRSRLARAHDKLRRRLMRRGLALSSANLTAVLSPGSTTARVSSLLWDTTTKTAIQFTDGQAQGKAMSTSVALLTQEVLRAMLINKLRRMLLIALVFGSIATGAGYLTHSLARDDGPGTDLHGQRQVTAQVAHQSAAPGRMFIVGRVLSPQGEPVPNATVMAYAQRDSPRQVIGHAQSDGSGLYRIDVRHVPLLHGMRV